MKRDGHFERAADLEDLPSAAKRMGIGRQWIYRMVQRGDFDYYTIGNRMMVHRADINKWIEKRERGTKRTESRSR